MDTIRIQARIKYATLIVGILASITLAIVFLLAIRPADLERAKEAIEVFGVGAALTSLVYTAMTVHNIHENTAAAIARDRTKYSAELVSQWHSPEMVSLTIKGYKIRQVAKERPGVDTLELIRSEADGERAIVCIFNYFEKLALSLEHGIADETYLRDFFAPIVRGYYHDLFGFATTKRRQLQTSKIFDRFEEMAKRWEDTPATHE